MTSTTVSSAAGADTGTGTTVLSIQRRSRLGRRRHLDASVEALVAAVQRAPGHLATTVERTPAGYQMHTVFDAPVHLRQWEASESYRALSPRLDRDGRASRRRLSAAASLPPPQGPHWLGQVIQTAAALLAVYPVSLLLQVATFPLVGGWPVPARVGVVTLPLALFMTLLIAPLLRRLPPPRPGTQRTGSHDHHPAGTAGPSPQGDAT